MDDLAGLDWSAPNKQQPPPLNPPAALPPFRQNPTPQLSGRSTPLSAQQSGAGSSLATNRAFKAPSKPATPANDSFAGLVSLNTSKPATSNLSLQERQKQLQEEKQRQEAEQRKQYDAQYGTPDPKFWDTLGSGKSTPEPTRSGIHPPAVSAPGRQTLSQAINKPFAGLDTSSKRPVQSPPADDDLLSAFNSAAPVDSSSHFPPPSHGSGRSTPAYGAASSTKQTSNAFVDDDDMFGLKQLAQKPAPSAQPAPSAPAEDDDILGLLGKPVTEFESRREPTPVVEERPSRTERRPSPGPNPHDKAVAELVDMGFPAEKSAIALATTESGLDVQAAVGWLLNQAHAEAKQRTRDHSQDRPRRSPDDFEERPRRGNSRTTMRDPSAGGSVPAWMRGEESRSRSGQRRPEGQTQEKDVSQYASEIGNTLFKSANSLWKTSQKKVQKAVAEFQNEGDPNVPKWMRNAQAGDDSDRPSQGGKSRTATPSGVTDEAMMLEGGGRPAKPPRPADHRPDRNALPTRQRREFEDQQSRHIDRVSSPSSSARQQSPSFMDKKSATRLTRQEVEEQSGQAYITKGSEAFKRGDYSAAHAAYSSALGPLPQTHPVTIIVLCNRAVTNIKVGDPKAAISDADAALAIIGISKGEGEKITLGGSEGEKDMKEFYGKALMRKAEALENMEKWGDAGKIWREAVEAGVGGAISIQGRNRCEKAANGGSKAAAPAARPPVRRPPPPKPTALSDLGGGPVSESEAVKKLKAANAAAEKVDDEKFQLSDQIDAKLLAWKGTKADNLRALLGSLDKVLWPEAGWNKVNMGDLVMPNKVKIVYMKAIAKVHPDKIPQTATTEQRMISAAVFATLNEAWDKFKTDNGL
ncbi:hypothetical protein BS50DRAFT_479802 [Corynespora cassiicola Philippines]|uniref:UBA domain-containing protein n=1 Tax=Corynespora cassiicola Philippines TaxID=1448308 RepID=A0A2T2P9W1_CORCC|nr:hypothetical protein BS50DRAFT_479802 [Corynespora cassiicola Philippines]